MLRLWIFVVAAAATSAGLAAVAVLEAPPPPVLPAIGLLCVACPAAAGRELLACTVWVRRLRAQLARLPETEHPLGL